VIQPPWILVDEALVHLGARRERAAREAPHLGQRAVQLDDAPAAGGVVQPIHVLRDDAGESPAALERGEREVGGVRARAREPHPPRGRARPVALPNLGAAQIGVMLDRVPRSGAALAPIIGDSRLGAAAGARERHEAPAGQEVDQRRERAIHGSPYFYRAQRPCNPRRAMVVLSAP
jgi:hypothetical protein